MPPVMANEEGGAQAESAALVVAELWFAPTSGDGYLGSPTDEERGETR